jgi:hypothetical protein
MPKVAFRHAVAHKRRADYRENSTDNRAAEGYKGGVVNARHLKDVPVVGKVDAPGQPHNTAHGDIGIVAYGVDNDVVKRPDADKGEQAENCHIGSVENYVAGSFSKLFHGCFLL